MCLSVREAARKIGVSRSKLYQLAARRQIGHYRLGGKIVVSDDDLNAYLERCHVAAVAPTATAAARLPLKLKHMTLS